MNNEYDQQPSGDPRFPNNMYTPHHQSHTVPPVNPWNTGPYDVPSPYSNIPAPPGPSNPAGGMNNYSNTFSNTPFAAPFANVLPAGINPDLLYGPATSVVNHYTQDISEKSKTWISGNLKYYFAVDDTYVGKKLLLLFFPFSHTQWSVRYSADGPIAPKDDVNAPDLYIPSMAYFTFLLLVGYIMGKRDEFSPAALGSVASSWLVWILVEVFLMMMILYLLSISCALGFLHLLAYSGYKFVPMVATVLISYIFNLSSVYYLILLYTSLSLSYFLLRSLYVTIQTTCVGNNSPQNGMYLVLLLCLVQLVGMYWYTSKFAISS